jgi:hypothetical protein
LKQAIYSSEAHATNLLFFCALFLGNAGDSLGYHNGMMFTTKDRDNDEASAANCAHTFRGGWWFRDCNTCNLNGVYLEMIGIQDTGITWFYWEKNFKSMKGAEMKMRPSKF